MRKVVVWGIVVVLVGVLIGFLVIGTIGKNDRVFLGGGNAACSALFALEEEVCMIDEVCACTANLDCGWPDPTCLWVYKPNDGYMCGSYPGTNGFTFCASVPAWGADDDMCTLAEKMYEPDTSDYACDTDSLCPFKVPKFTYNYDEDSECCSASLAIYCKDTLSRNNPTGSDDSRGPGSSNFDSN